MRLLEGEDTTRMDALSDGLFAIVLTLLVLQFEIPDVDPGALPGALTAQWPLLFSYLLSFAVVGLYWIIHHNLFQNIVRHDRVLLYLNLLFLLTVSFLPFPTELLGTYGTHFTWTLYAINFAFVGGSLTLVWCYAVARDFTAESIDRRLGWLIAVRGLISPVVFLFSIGVAAISLEAAFFTPILIVPLQALWVRYYPGGTRS
ncbi:TMEM175 family protein [Natronobiforma cellulositropha]|uniref:TMEM175 family protein n=1 Tax=Natronobiforma cellulositropha TaxID=1679076 RepID=UPI0021D57A79|nr:TMEM175 family protein [Natronobiforma cellulositropha]